MRKRRRKTQKSKIKVIGLGRKKSQKKVIGLGRKKSQKKGKLFTNVERKQLAGIVPLETLSLYKAQLATQPK